MFDSGRDLVTGMIHFISLGSEAEADTGGRLKPTAINGLTLTCFNTAAKI